MDESLDLVYDRLVAEERLKRGSKYERLAAVVFKVLDSSALVVHDVRLRAPGKASVHQIDVDVTLGHERKRILIECRDRTKAVNLSQVRDFKGVLAQLEPDEAFVVSRSGFTPAAKTYAREEGIRLAVLRRFEEADWEGRLRRINIEMRIRSHGDPKITGWIWKDQEEEERIRSALAGVQVERRFPADEVYFYDAAGHPDATFAEVLQPVFTKLDIKPGLNEGTHQFDRVRYVDVEGIRAGVRGFSYEVQGFESVDSFTIGPGSRIAELVFRTMDGTVDQIMFDEDFRGWKFSDDGEVVPRL